MYVLNTGRFAVCTGLNKINVWSFICKTELHNSDVCVRSPKWYTGLEVHINIVLFYQLYHFEWTRLNDQNASNCACANPHAKLSTFIIDTLTASPAVTLTPPAPAIFNNKEPIYGIKKANSPVFPPETQNAIYLYVLLYPLLLSL